MKYYVDLPNGERKAITEWMYEALVRLHGWVHVLREDNLEVIRKL